jgi:hypothetical protein
MPRRSLGEIWRRNGKAEPYRTVLRRSRKPRECYASCLDWIRLNRKYLFTRDFSLTRSPCKSVSKSWRRAIFASIDQHIASSTRLSLKSAAFKCLRAWFLRPDR